MSYEWSRRERFLFWSKMERVRVGAIVGLALVPLSIAALDTPLAKRETRAFVKGLEPRAQQNQVRSVRFVEFDVGKLDLESLGDGDMDARRSTN